MPDPDEDRALTYAGVYDEARLAEMRVTDLLDLSAQTRWSRRDVPGADHYEEDLRIVRSRIAAELRRRDVLRRRHPPPSPGTAVTIAEEPVDWPFPACSTAPAPGTTGTVVAYQAVLHGPRRRARLIRIARRFYVAVRMGDDFGHAPGSTFPVPVWQVSAADGAAA